MHGRYGSQASGCYGLQRTTLCKQTLLEGPCRASRGSRCSKSKIYAFFQKDETDAQTPVRVLLLGKTGAGKSLLGNKLLGQERFIVGGAQARATTQNVLSRQGTKLTVGPVVVVTDTPGLDAADDKSRPSTTTELTNNVADIRSVNMVVSALQTDVPGAVLFLSKFGDVFTKSDQVMLRRYQYCLRDQALWKDNFAIVFTHAFAGYAQQNEARAQDYALQVGEFLADALDCPRLQPKYFCIDTLDASADATLDSIRSWLGSRKILATQMDSLVLFEDDRKWKKLREDTRTVVGNRRSETETISSVANGVFEMGAMGGLAGLLLGAGLVAYQWSRAGFPALALWLTGSMQPVLIVHGALLALTVLGMAVGAYWVQDVGTWKHTVTTWEEEQQRRVVWLGIDGASEFTEDWATTSSQQMREEQREEVLMPRFEEESAARRPMWAVVLRQLAQVWVVGTILAFAHRIASVAVMLLGIKPLLPFLFSFPRSPKA